MPDRVFKSNQTPFDLYDFFGYLFPGMFFGVGLFVVHALFSGTQTVAIVAQAQSLATAFKDFKFVEAVLVLVVIFLMFYVFGHLVASFGSLLFEKKLLKGIFGYPTQYYLDVREKHQRKVAESVYKITFMLFNATLIIGILSIDFPKYEAPFLACLKGLKWLLIIWFLLLLGFRPLLTWVQKRFVLAWLETVRKLAVASLYWTVFFLIDLPITLVFGSTGVLKRFDPDTIDAYKRKFYNDFELDVDEVDTNVFWLSYVFLVQHSPNSLPTIRNFLHMFSFARNTAAATFLLLAITLSVKYVFGAQITPGNAMLLYMFSMILYIFGLVMLLRYFYLYSSYFTKYILRSYLIAEKRGQQPT